VGVIGLGDGRRALPAVEIVPGEGEYVYSARYTAGKTEFMRQPGCPRGLPRMSPRWRRRWQWRFIQSWACVTFLARTILWTRRALPVS
jgi:hypothetical protein